MLNVGLVPMEDLHRMAVGSTDAVVRRATRGDEIEIYDTIVSVYGQDFLGRAHTPEKVKRWIAAGASRADEEGGMIGVIDADGIIAATIGIFPSQPWYSDEPILVENWLCVRPSYRHRDYHKALFEFARAYKHEMSAAMGREIDLVSSVTSEDRLEAKVRLWSRFGRMIGAMFLVED